MNWLYIIFLLSLATACIFSFIRFFIRWKRNPRSILQSLLLTITLIGLFAGAYVSGNGNPLPVSGYEGNENTVFWLKLTDMWLYCLYILLALTLISLFGGIIWSYIKRTR
jgi:CDP-diglyceride synthetase